MLLARLRAVVRQHAPFRLLGEPEDLYELEWWYTVLHIHSAFGEIGLAWQDFETACEFYSYDLACRRLGFEWIVEESAFAPGHWVLIARRGLGSIHLRLEPSVTPIHRKRRRMKSTRWWEEYATLISMAAVAGIDGSPLRGKNTRFDRRLPRSTVTKRFPPRNLWRADPTKKRRPGPPLLRRPGLS